MKLNVISDLHCFLKKNGEVEWLDFEPEKLLPADYLIVAGDTGYAQNEHIIHQELRKRTEGKFKKVLTIRGNHSYWVTESYEEEIIPEAYETVMIPNEKIDLIDGNVAILGTTLWTNETSYGEVRGMNDYRYIPEFSPETKEARFKEESEWLRKRYSEEKAAGRKIVIVTHHNPRSMAELPENSWEHADVATAYWVGKNVLDDIQPNVWICGHIHEDLDCEFDGTRFVRHPIGYRWGFYKVLMKRNPTIKESWYNKIIEI